MKTLKTLSSQLLNLDVRLLMMLVMVALMVMPELAMAAETSDLPFSETMTKVSKALTGPFVTAISVVAIVGAGAMLIFGGDMNGFMRTLIFLVMVIAMMVTASKFVNFLGADAAVLASYVPSAVSDVQRLLV